MTRLDPEQVKASVSLADLASRFLTLTKAGKEYRALCPWHEDNKPSLTIYEKRGQWQFKCFACGEGGDVFSFYALMNGLDLKADFRKIVDEVGNGAGHGTGTIVVPPLKKAPPREIVPCPAGVPAPEMGAGGELGGSVHPYLDADGNLIAFAVYREGEREPQYWTYGRYSPVDPPRWERRGWRENAPLYGLEQLARKPDAQVLICGSERAADAAGVLLPTMAAIAYPGGLGGYKLTDWRQLEGRKIVLWPDADEAGRQAMQRVAALLKGLAAEVKGIDPDTQPDGSPTPEAWDAADALAAGWDRERTLAWAKPRITVYVAAQQTEADAPEPETAQNAPESRQQDAEATGSRILPDTPLETHPDAPQGQSDPVLPMPEPEFPPEATVTRPKRPRKPALASVDGNTVRVLEIEPEAEIPPQFSEFALAVAFADGPGQDWRYTHDSCQWHKWIPMGDGGIWELQKTKSHTIAIQNFATSEQFRSRSLTDAQRSRICSMKTVNAVVPLVQPRPPIAALVDQWDADPWILGLPDGTVVDLKTGVIRPAQREDMISRRALVAPERGPHPHWNMVLGRASNGDDAMLEYLRLWAGCCATGDTSPEAFTYLYGKGGAGKSKYILPLQDILHDYARQIPIELFLAAQRENKSEQLAQLPGVRLAIASEPDEGTRWAEGQLKQATGRNRISCRDVYAHRIEYVPQFKLMFEGNHKPHLRGVGEEIRRRFKLVEFKGGSIPEEDRILDMPARLKHEYPAILQWIIDGAVDFAREGLNMPEQMETDVSDYLRSEDQIAAWMDDCCDIDNAQRVRVADAYENYKAWCTKDGEFVVTKKTFCSRLNDRGYQTQKSGDRFLRGFALRLGANL